MLSCKRIFCATTILFTILFLIIVLSSSNGYGSEKKFYIQYDRGWSSQATNFLNEEERQKVLDDAEKAFSEKRKDGISKATQKCFNYENTHYSEEITKTRSNTLSKTLDTINQDIKSWKVKNVQSPPAFSIKTQKVALGYQISPYLTLELHYQIMEANNQIEHTVSIVDKCGKPTSPFVRVAQFTQSATIHNGLFIGKGVLPLPKVPVRLYMQGGVGGLGGREIKFINGKNKATLLSDNRYDRPLSFTLPIDLVLAFGGGLQAQCSSHCKIDLSYLHLYAHHTNQFNLFSIGFCYSFDLLPLHVS